MQVMAGDDDGFRKYECAGCGFIYDEAIGLPSKGIAPGTRFDDLPDDFECPECACGKKFFQLMAA